MSEKISVGEYHIDKAIVDIYVFTSNHMIGFEKICEAIDRGGGQTCDINGVLKALNEAGYMVSGK